MKSPSEVSDADLTKAASNAAAAVGSGAVMDVLSEFKVKQLRDLKGDQRSAFVARMRELVEKGAE